MWERIRAVGLGFLALVWPTACVGCGVPDVLLCDDCRTEIVWGATSPSRVPTPATEVVVSGLGARCLSAREYQGATRAALIAYKHRGAYRFAGVLGRALAPALQEGIALATAAHGLVSPVTTFSTVSPASPARSAPIVVTVPSRASKVRERGFRHVEVLVRVALHELSLRGAGNSPQLLRALAAGRGRGGQVGRQVHARLANAAHLRVRVGYRERLRGREVILVDDIVASGASVLAAERCLLHAGARVVAVVTLCFVTRKDTTQQ